MWVLPHFSWLMHLHRQMALFFPVFVFSMVASEYGRQTMGRVGQDGIRLAATRRAV
jgi:hypothetical protein